VSWSIPEHPVFAEPECVPDGSHGMGGKYAICGQHVEALSGSRSLAGRATAADGLGESAMVLGNEGRTVFKGFVDGNNDSDLDRDGVPDGAELWANLAFGIQRGFAADAPWVSMETFSGTLSPGRAGTSG